jgi:hypothetical protein
MAKAALDTFELLGGVIIVDMNDLGVCDFRTRIKAIGTRDLNGCHVVAVIFDYGAILAHIAPRSGQQHTEDP